jgi:hypothetical protein
MKIKIKKIGFVELGIYCTFLLLPFTLFLNKIVFKDFRIAGIGIMNLMLYVFLCIVFIDSVINKKTYYNRNGIYLFYILFVVLHILKMLQPFNNFNTLYNFINKNQYYYILPLCLLMLNNKKIDFLLLVKIIIYSSLIVSIISIPMFLTSNYYGLASKVELTYYKILGTSFTRMLSIFGSPLTAGTYFAIVFTIIYYVFKFNSLFYILTGGLNLLCMFLTFSKTAIIALILMFACKYMSENKNVLKKLLKIIALIMSLIIIIIFMTNKGIYFWNANELFHNVRLTKWYSSLNMIKQHIILGNRFDILLNTKGSFETILSDNSFLFAIAIFGLLFWIIILIYVSIYLLKKDKEFKQRLMPIIIMSIIFLFLYDFVQLFPANILLIALYKIVENIDTENFIIQREHRNERKKLFN